MEATVHTRLDILHKTGRKGNLELYVRGRFDPADVKEIARSFATLTQSISHADDEPLVRLFAKGWWESADGHTLFLDRGTNPIRKVGRKYFRIGNVDGETVKATPLYDSDNPTYQNGHVEIKEGSITDYTSL